MMAQPPPAEAGAGPSVQWGAMLRAAALLACACLAGGPALGQGAFESLAAFETEAAAERRAAELGLGSAEFVGPAAATVGEFGEFTLRFTVGAAGMATGGGLRIATQHDFEWDMWGGTRLQDAHPARPNFVTYGASTGAALRWRAANLDFDYFPWQRVNEFLLEGGPLRSGDRIEIVFGDRSGGSPGVEIQPMDESAFEQRVFVDAYGRGEFLPLARSPALEIRGGAARELVVQAPTDWAAGAPGWVNVWLDDGLGNPATGYRGTVALAAAAEGARLPPPHAFREEDRSAFRFRGVVFDAPGRYRVLARDSEGREARSNPIVVHERMPQRRILWGDLHTHTRYSDGRGTPEEMFEFGRRYGALDFCAISDHGFITTDAMWEDIKAATKRAHRPGEYVTLLGYEWSGPREVGGDHNVYTADDEMPLVRAFLRYNYANLRQHHGPARQAGHVEDLYRALAEGYRDENLLTIPHFGGRPGNPAWHNERLQRGIEIFSDHRRSEDWVATFLERGHRVGIVASTDNHAGNAGYGVRRRDVTRGAAGAVFSRFSPAERGTALMAVAAEGLTREAVFQGIYHRCTYATTGERIVLRFAAGGEPMGGETRASGPVAVSASVVGTGRIALVRIVKNGRIVYSVDPRAEAASFEFVDPEGAPGGAYYYLDLVQADGEKAVSSPVWVN